MSVRGFHTVVPVKLHLKSCYRYCVIVSVLNLKELLTYLLFSVYIVNISDSLHICALQATDPYITRIGAHRTSTHWRIERFLAVNYARSHGSRPGAEIWLNNLKLLALDWV